MDAYQELLNERNKLAAQVTAQAVEINALEQSTAVRMGKRLKRFAPLLYQALRVARVARRLRNKLRRPVRVATSPGTGTVDTINDDRPTVFVLVHEATDTARPLLGRALMRELRKTYRIVAVLLGDGPIAASFAEAADAVVGPLNIGADDYAAGLGMAEGLAAGHKPRFAIAAGAETRHLAIPLSTAGVPTIALIHELPLALLSPSSTTRGLLDRADDIVFSCKPVEDLYGPFYGRLDYRRTHVIAPGQVGKDKTAGLLRDRLAYIPADAFLVLGQGIIEYRSGVDAFVTTATAWRTQNPQAKFHFVWIGRAPDKDYSQYIDEQIARADMRETVTLLFERDDTQAVYSDVDILYATARLDYLPSPAIDFALAGKPVACFANAGGIAEILVDDSATARLVLPHMDIPSAVALLNDLAQDRALAASLGQAAEKRVRAACDIGTYARQLAAFGEDAAKARAERPATVKMLTHPGNFDAALYAGNIVPDAALPKLIEGYLERSYYDGFRKRTLAGFHPELYASQTPDFKSLRLDPLTHYLKAGRPTGPWIHKVIRLDLPEKPEAETGRVAVHGHFYYVDHFDIFLKALAANRTRVDLFLTTGSEENRQYLLRATSTYAGGKSTVEIVPNKGRDIGPFLHLYRQTLHGNYDFIGHVHGKRSLHTAKWDPNLGERWRNFMFQHLIGPKTAAMDIILKTFNENPRLGLVFPEDPNVIGWDFDFEHAQRMGERMGFKTTLPKHIDFPIGTMFWARGAALKPLLRLDIAWDDYPSEPLPVDGTILHALERLIPSIAREAGYDYAATYFPGVGR